VNKAVCLAGTVGSLRLKHDNLQLVEKTHKMSLLIITLLLLLSGHAVPLPTYMGSRCSGGRAVI